MDWIRDEDIQPMWLRNYPRRTESGFAHAVCSMLTVILQEKAIGLTFTDDYEKQLNQILGQFGIPQEEFDQFQKERYQR